MPATSEKQRRAAGMALAVKRGTAHFTRKAGAAASMAKSMTIKQLREFARKIRK